MHELQNAEHGCPPLREAQHWAICSDLCMPSEVPHRKVSESPGQSAKTNANEMHQVFQIPRSVEGKAVAKVLGGAYTKVVDRWKLNDQQAAELLHLNEDDWKAVKIDPKRWEGHLDDDMAHIICAVIAVYAEARHCFGEKLGDRWVRSCTSAHEFAGNQPIDVMIEGGYERIMDVREFLLAQPVGW